LDFWHVDAAALWQVKIGIDRGDHSGDFEVALVITDYSAIGLRIP
jgi:hypothetical protein